MAPSVLVVERSDDAVRDTAAHSHASGQLIGSLRGLLSLTTEDGCWAVPATHGIWIPPHRQHGLRSHGPFAGWSVYVSEQICEGLPDAPRTVRISGLLREAIHRAASWHETSRSDAQERLSGVIIDEIANLPEEPLGLSMPSSAQVQRVASAMLGDLSDSRGLEAWAKSVGMSTRTLSRRFIAETGFSFTAWRQRARLLRSLELLADGMAVTTIALELGYENVSAFIALFRRTFGCTPTHYATREML
jgi:AraC-like DNA-binding protein